MKVLLVGPPDARERLRRELDTPEDVVAEFDTPAAARASGVTADALLVAPEVFGEPSGTPGPAVVEEALTAREQEVLELLAQGLTNKAIATRLDISDQTVKFHLSSITGKLAASNRTDAVRRAVRRGLVTL